MWCQIWWCFMGQSAIFLTIPPRMCRGGCAWLDHAQNKISYNYLWIFLFCLSHIQCYLLHSCLLPMRLVVVGRPFLCRVVFIEVACWQFLNNPPSSDSVVEAMMLRMILHSECIVPFYGGIFDIGILFLRIGPKVKSSFFTPRLCFIQVGCISVR